VELRHLRYFIVIAEELNLRRAAERLNISHPPLSRQLQDLEAEIGVNLIVRGTRGLALSHAGEVFLAEARMIVSHAAAAIDHAREAGRGEAGRLRIAYSFGYFDPSLARVMKLFRERFPKVRMEMQQLDPWQQAEGLQRNRIDVAYIGLRFQRLQEHLHFECIRRAAIRVALPVGHALCAGERVEIAALADQAFISLGGAFPDYPGWLARLCAAAGFAPRIAHEADTSATLLGLVSAGVGVAVLPALHDPPVFEVAFRPLAPAPPEFEFDVAWRRDDRSIVLHNFIALLKAEIQPDIGAA
jgi:DNA-binding transcriptional LysR family regulator